MNATTKNLVDAVKYALSEAEHYTGAADRPCMKLDRLNVPDGVFDWLGKAAAAVEAEAAGVFTAKAENDAFRAAAQSVLVDIAYLGLTTRGQVCRYCELRFCHPCYRAGVGGSHVWVAQEGEDPVDPSKLGFNRVLLITGTGPDWQ